MLDSLVGALLAQRRTGLTSLSVTPLTVYLLVHRLAMVVSLASRYSVWPLVGLGRMSGNAPRWTASVVMELGAWLSSRRDKDRDRESKGH